MSRRIRRIYPLTFKRKPGFRRVLIDRPFSLDNFGPHRPLFFTHPQALGILTPHFEGGFLVAWRQSRFILISALLLVVVAIVITLWAERHYSRATKAKNVSDDLLGIISQMEGTLALAETGQRGFLWTKDERYLPTYDEAKKSVVMLISRFEHASRDPEINAKFMLLKRVMIAKLSELEHTLELMKKKEHSDIELQKSVTDNLQYSTQLREQFAALRALILQFELQAESKVALYRSVATSGIVTIFICAFFLMAITHFQNTLARQQLELLEIDAQRRGLNARLQVILKNMPMGCMVTDEKGLIIYWNPACEDVYGYKENEVLNRSIYGLLLEDYRRNDYAYVTEQLHAGVPVVSGVTRNRKRDGSWFWCEWHCSLVQAEDKRLSGYLTMLSDVTLQKESHESLEEHKQQLSELSQRLLTAHADERKRVAQIVHDQLAQNLAAVKLTLDGVLINAAQQQELESEIKVWREHMPRLLLMLSHALGDARELLNDLRPPLLEEFGIIMALKNDVMLLARPGDLLIEWPSEQLVIHRFPAHVEQTVFFVLREAINNAMSHAKASKIVISVQETTNDTIFSVVDDGVGFDPGAMARLPGHYGLIGMRERANSIGAGLSIQSKLNRGTEVQLSLRVEQ